MPLGPGFGLGFQRLLDTNQRFLRAGNPVYLRLRNFPDVQGQKWAQLGFSIAPSGGTTGTEDILIDPPASSEPVSVHNIGMSMGKLRFGATKFVVSGSFVDRQQKAMGIDVPDSLWHNPLVVGLFSGGLLYSIEDVIAKQLAGKTILWLLVCNSLETK